MKFNNIKPLKIELLPQDGTSVLLNSFDDKEKVVFVNLKKDDELMENQREFIRVCSKYFMIYYQFTFI